MHLSRRMIERAHADMLPPSHELQVRAKELHSAYMKRFVDQPPNIGPSQFVDVFIRAYAAWHAHTGED